MPVNFQLHLCDTGTPNATPLLQCAPATTGGMSHVLTGDDEISLSLYSFHSPTNEWRLTTRPSAVISSQSPVRMLA